MWGKIMILMYRLRLHGIYGLYGPRCPLSPERPLNLITHSLTFYQSEFIYGYFFFAMLLSERQYNYFLYYCCINVLMLFNDCLIWYWLSTSKEHALLLNDVSPSSGDNVLSLTNGFNIILACTIVPGGTEPSTSVLPILHNIKIKTFEFCLVLKLIGPNISWTGFLCALQLPLALVLDAGSTECSLISHSWWMGSSVSSGTTMPTISQQRCRTHTGGMPAPVTHTR